MKNLIKVMDRIDFDLLHTQTEGLIKIMEDLKTDMVNTPESEDAAKLQEDIDNLLGIIEMNDSLMIAASDDGVWVDPTRNGEWDDI